MSDTKPHVEAGADRRAAELLKADLGQLRMGRKTDRVIIGIVALAWAFFQPGLPRFIILDSITIRAIHLSFAVALTFLAYRGVSVTKYLSQIILTTEGIYGIPLGVSATTVYLFVMFGALLERLGAGKFFNDLAISLLGRYIVGPAKASVVSGGLTGLVSGSSIANVVTTGTFTIPLMKKVGYPPKTAAATEVAASTNGQLMPPIMGAAAFIMAEYLAISYFDVIRAAFLPAFVSYIALFYITHLEASKLGMKGLPPEDTPNFLEVLKNGWYHLVPLIWLIVELAALRHSPNLSVFNATVILVAIMVIVRIVTAIRQKTGVATSLWSGIKLLGDGRSQLQPRRDSISS